MASTLSNQKSKFSNEYVLKFRDDPADLKSFIDVDYLKQIKFIAFFFSLNLHASTGCSV